LSHEDIATALLSTRPQRRMGVRKYTSMHSYPRHSIEVSG